MFVAIVVALATNASLMAQDDTTHIYFSANGGVGTMDDIVVLSGTLVCLPPCGYTREGYDFIGWSSNTGDSYNVVNYPNLTCIRLNMSLDLHAVWKSNCTDKIVTLDTTVCDSLVWVLRGMVYKSSTTQSDVVSGVVPGGCDSIYNLTLKVKHTATSWDTHTACDTFTWSDGVEYTESTEVPVIRFAGMAANGCDSVVGLHLTVNKSKATTVDTTVCDTLVWLNNSVYTASTSGIKTVLRTTKGCDSTVTLNLTVNNSFYRTTAASVCDSMEWNVDGKTYYKDTVAVWKGTRINRCDSVHTLNLTVNKSYRYYDTVAACDSYVWPRSGMTYTLSGDKVVPGSTVGGCDSNMYLALTVNKSFQQQITPVVCDSFYWTVTDSVYRASCMEEVKKQTVNGCDSVRTMRLTVNYSRTGQARYVECDSLYWPVTQRFYYSSLDTVYTTSTLGGCDSVVACQLVINKSYAPEIVDSICSGDTYTFRDQTFTSEGNYYFRARTVDNCDSTTVLRLNVLHYPSVDFIIDYSCDSAYYYIRLKTPVDYAKWSCDPSDPSLSGQEYRFNLKLTPRRPTVYTVLCDYVGNKKMCPTTKELRLTPVVVPEPKIDLHRNYVTEKSPTLIARDNSKNSMWRTWYLQGEYAGSGVVLQTDIDVASYLKNEQDSLVLSLEVNSGTCKAQTDTVIHIRSAELEFPTAFTPDEVLNNTFGPVSSGITKFAMTVYDRMGAVVFKSSSVEAQWNGNNTAGQPCPQGSYVYVVEYETLVLPNIPQKRVGTVTILR